VLDFLPRPSCRRGLRKRIRNALAAEASDRWPRRRAFARRPLARSPYGTAKRVRERQLSDVAPARWASRHLGPRWRDVHLGRTPSVSAKRGAHARFLQAKRQRASCGTSRLNVVPSERPTGELVDVRLDGRKQECAAGVRHDRGSDRMRGTRSSAPSRVGPLVAGERGGPRGCCFLAWGSLVPARRAPVDPAIQ
jgi:hypothetical protein